MRSTKVDDWIDTIWLPSESIEPAAFDYDSPFVNAVALPDVSPEENPQDNPQLQDFASFWQNAVFGDAWFQWETKSLL